MSVDVLYPAQEENARSNEHETRLETLQSVFKERDEREAKMESRHPWVPIIERWLLVLLAALLVITLAGWGIRVAKEKRDDRIREEASKEAVDSYKKAQQQAEEDEYISSGQKAKDDARAANAIMLAKDSGIWKNEAAFKTHCWNVLLRVKSPKYPDTIQAVLVQPKQYEYADLDSDMYQTEKYQWALEVLEQDETGRLPAYLTLYHLFEEIRNGGTDCVLHTDYDRGPSDDPWRYRE